ncbi:MAG: PIN domain-containing protein, partial [Fervidobacterium sp.]
MLKNFILDTNVLVHDPEAIFSFEENNVFIPLPVIEELDKLKREHGRIGKN